MRRCPARGRSPILLGAVSYEFAVVFPGTEPIRTGSKKLADIERVIEQACPTLEIPV
jgi:hypothetical protein